MKIKCAHVLCQESPLFQVSFVNNGIGYKLVCENHLIEIVKLEATEGRMVHIMEVTRG